MTSGMKRAYWVALRKTTRPRFKTRNEEDFWIFKNLHCRKMLKENVVFRMSREDKEHYSRIAKRQFNGNLTSLIRYCIAKSDLPPRPLNMREEYAAKKNN